MTGRNKWYIQCLWYAPIIWCSLEQRIVDARLTLLYEIIHGLISIELKDHLKYSIRNGKIIQLQTKTAYFRFSPLPCTVIQWRGLHSNVTDSQTLEVFKEQSGDYEAWKICSIMAYPDMLEKGLSSIHFNSNICTNCFHWGLTYA